jgi:hypothetical protein
MTRAQPKGDPTRESSTLRLLWSRSTREHCITESFMSESRGVSRRGFVKAVGGLAGAAALPGDAWAQSPATETPQVSGSVQPALAPGAARAVGSDPFMGSPGCPCRGSL